MQLKGMRIPQWSQLLKESFQPSSQGMKHLFICIADHFEPDWGNAADDVRQERVERWVNDYPSSVAGLYDSIGRSPRHTFFYPLEEYRPTLLDRLSDLCHAGHGEVEVHLHHDRDTSEQLREKLDWFKETLFHSHDLLHRDQTGNIRYGFIHGNWALDNSRPDGCWCGVNDEITVLRETGCYADFTMPSAPEPAQTRMINKIYYAVDDPKRCKSHDTGTQAEVGRRPPFDGLLMIQGPLVLDWQDRKFGFFPRLENGDLHSRRPPSARRIPLWEKAGVQVRGRSEWEFLKLHTHGAKPANADVLLGKPMREMHLSLMRRAEEDPLFRYYYVTAREMANLVHAAEDGMTDPEAVLRQRDRLNSNLPPNSELTAARFIPIH